MQVRRRGILENKEKNMDRILSRTIGSLITSFLFSQLVFAQKTLTITDPEIEFSISAPNDWKVQDDGYYYILLIPGGEGIEHLSITYFETHENSVNDQFDGLINAALPMNETAYKLLTTGDATVDNEPAKWAIYNSTVNGIDVTRIAYMFISCGQIFQIQGTAKRAQLEQYQEEFKRTIESIKAKRN